MLKAWQIVVSPRIRKELLKCNPSVSPFSQVPQRHQTGYTYGKGSYHGSRLVDNKNPDQYTKVEKSHDEWKHVEKLIPPVYVPKPPMDPNILHPSGWSSPKFNKDNCPLPYLIPRTKNFMIPIYLWIYKPSRGTLRRTIIKNVEGNIWALEKEVGAYLQAKYTDKVIVTWVNETWRRVTVRGEYVNDLQEWALGKGF